MHVLQYMRQNRITTNFQHVNRTNYLLSVNWFQEPWNGNENASECRLRKYLCLMCRVLWLVGFTYAPLLCTSPCPAHLPFSSAILWRHYTLQPDVMRCVVTPLTTYLQFGFEPTKSGFVARDYTFWAMVYSITSSTKCSTTWMKLFSELVIQVVLRYLLSTKISEFIYLYILTICLFALTNNAVICFKSWFLNIK